MAQFMVQLHCTTRTERLPPAEQLTFAFHMSNTYALSVGPKIGFRRASQQYFAANTGHFPLLFGHVFHSFHKSDPYRIRLKVYFHTGYMRRWTNKTGSTGIQKGVGRERKKNERMNSFVRVPVCSYLNSGHTHQ